jgi:PAS domain-containing protein
LPAPFVTPWLIVVVRGVMEIDRSANLALIRDRRRSGMGMHQERHWIRRVRTPASLLTSPVEVEPATLPALPAAWQCDLVTEELHWSNGVFDLFGIPPGSAIDRRSTLEFYLPESRRLLDRLRSEALETCGSFTFEAQIRRLDGGLRWMRLNADVQKRNGRAVMLYGTKQDITAEMAG